MTVTGAACKLAGKVPFPLTFQSPAHMFAEPNKKPASKGEMWFAEFQPRYHKADYRILDLHLRENSLRNMTAAIHSFIDSFNKYVAKYCARYFSGAWHKSVKKNLDLDLCPHGDRKDRSPIEKRWLK